jgi:mannose-6-phosphate isomerase-like protein (cupin superfamily)
MSGNDEQTSKDITAPVHCDLAHLLSKIPGAISTKWPQGERLVQALTHGTMSVELYAPLHEDPQTPHAQDELYFVLSGDSTFVHEGVRVRVSAGSALFVPAGDEHRFEDFSSDFVTWVVFWGPEGGER